MTVKCTNCGGQHPAWDCKRPAAKPQKKSTAARMDVPNLVPRKVTPLQQPKKEQREVTAGSARVERQQVGANLLKANAPDAKAGTQAPPVDKFQPIIRSPGDVSRVLDGLDTKKRGRPILPSPKSSRAAYQRELMRKRRAAAKEKS